MTCMYEAIGSLNCPMDTKTKIEKFDPSGKPIYEFWWFYVLLLLFVAGFLILIFGTLMSTLS